MAIPDFQSIMRPLLEHLRDGEPKANQETLEALADHFGLSDEERTERLPSGQQTVFTNRVAWAKSHMKGARLLQSPKRAHYVITERGKALLSTHGGPIDMRVLQQFPEYVKFRRPKKNTGENGPPDLDTMSPEEHLEVGYQRHRFELASELLDQVKKCSPAFFESLVVELLVAMGYGGSRQDAGKTVGRSGDGGIDGVIKEDQLGLDTIFIQAKRWENTVGRPEVQKFAGALQGQRAKKGVFITTSDFTREAQSYASRLDTKIVLIDGDELARLMIDHGIGVTQAATYSLSRLNADYFENP